MAGFTVVSVLPNQVEDASTNLIDVYDVTFAIDGRPGTFTVEVPQAGDPVTAASEAINAELTQVAGIYAL